MSDYDFDPDAPIGADEAADYKSWRAQRDAEAAAKRPKPIDYANTPNPRDEALEIGRKVIAEGGTIEEGMAAHVDHLLRAAAAGDVRTAPDYSHG